MTVSAPYPAITATMAVKPTAVPTPAPAMDPVITIATATVTTATLMAITLPAEGHKYVRSTESMILTITDPLLRYLRGTTSNPLPVMDSV